MKRISSCRFEAAIAKLTAVSSFFLLAASAGAQGYEPAHTLPWPLYAGDPAVPSGKNGGPGLTAPRPALGNDMGEYQHYGSDRYLHSGADIRGVKNDPIFAVADGYVWLKKNFDTVINLESDFCVDSSICRFYVAGADKRYIYYYSHVNLQPTAPNYTTEFHKKIVNATATAPSGGTFPTLAFNESQRVNQGELLTGIADFSTWNHLHFGIVDGTQNFDVINPLTALARSADGVELVDDEKPTIASLDFYQDETENLVSTTGTCNALPANPGALDVVGRVKDSFYSTDPAPTGISGDYATIGPFYGEYRIQKVGDPEVAPVVWYDFSRAPLRCKGPNRGLSCPTRQATEAGALQEFFDHSLRAEAGALNPGSLNGTDFYASVLFSGALSDSYDFRITDGEKHFAVFTNSWGQNGSWDATAAVDGLYRVSVETRDEAGNRTANSRLVFVNNDGSAPANFRDAYIRDNSVETGALPSTIGGQPFWTSPDIVITKDGQPLAEPRVIAGQTYQVYLDVHNPTCGDVRGVKARLFTANPSMIQDSTDWVDFSSGFAGSVDVPALTSKRLGPFSWTPTTEEAENQGHRCMLAIIDSTDDPVKLDIDQVASDNNIAQLNLQIDQVQFSIRNPEPEQAELELELQCNGFPINTPGGKVEIRVQSHPALVAAWSTPYGATVTTDGTDLVVSYQLCNVRLPPVSLPAGTVLPSSAELVLPPNVRGSYTVDFSQYTNGTLSGGVSFNVSRADDVPR